MSPYGEAFGDVRFKAQYQEQSTYGASGDQRQRCEIPGAQKSDDQKGGEEDSRRTEVAHDRQR